MAENLTTENLKSASNLTVISEITNDISVICAENDTLKTFPLKSINREELDTIKTDLEKIKPKCEKYKQNYSYNDLGVYITGAHNRGGIVSQGGRFTAEIAVDNITYFIDVLFEAKNNNLYARVLSNNSPLSICQVTDEYGLNQFYLMNKNGSGIYTINVLQYSDFTLNDKLKISATVSSELFKQFTVINPIDEPPTE